MHEAKPEDLSHFQDIHRAVEGVEVRKELTGGEDGE
jgi:hypothetical protein